MKQRRAPTRLERRGMLYPLARSWRSETTPRAGWSDAGSLTRVVEEKPSMDHAGTTTRDAVPARMIRRRNDGPTRGE
ncbi:hypothetical protein DY000_02008816 [Brassica cretica]|uniref:Uncharacterized protein n=1 Tax=Brassica cretica TaxID=69181 RepID=A0ABQ7BW13_BRACR|nr:hypothetical protein DY000_02008816 [Brassica cretica]